MKFTGLNLRVLTVLFLSQTALQIAMAQSSPVAQTQAILRPEQIENLKEVIWNSTQKQNKSYIPTEFNGSYDWHSDVHAHWALLSMARVTKDADLEAKILSVLTIDRLEREADFLLSPQWETFEKPYGRTWFLLLLWEMNHRPIANSHRFQALRYKLTMDMLSWLKTSKFPEQYSIISDSGLIGTHDSWLMSLFLFDTAKSQNSKIANEIDRLIETKLRPLAAAIEKEPLESNDFLYLPAVRYLIDPTSRYQHSVLALPTSNDFACHFPGAIQVSYWAQAAQCARHDSRACEIVTQASQEFFAQTSLWRDDFNCVAHWVPQFIWMNHWLSLGKP